MTAELRPENAAGGEMGRGQKLGAELRLGGVVDLKSKDRSRSQPRIAGRGSGRLWPGVKPGLRSGSRAGVGLRGSGSLDQDLRRTCAGLPRALTDL